MPTGFLVVNVFRVCEQQESRLGVAKISLLGMDPTTLGSVFTFQGAGDGWVTR